MVTEELKPLIEVRVMGTTTSWPWNTEAEGGQVSEKSDNAEAVLIVLVVSVDVTMFNVVEPESPIGLPIAVTV
jgi:hypothetical protein